MSPGEEEDASAEQKTLEVAMEGDEQVRGGEGSVSESVESSSPQQNVDETDTAEVVEQERGVTHSNLVESTIAEETEEEDVKDTVHFMLDGVEQQNLFTTPRPAPLEERVRAKLNMHTRHLSYEDWHNMNLNQASIFLSRQSLSLEGRAGKHRRRQSVNPLERAAEEVLFSSQVHTARSIATTTKLSEATPSEEGSVTSERRDEPAGSLPGTGKSGGDIGRKASRSIRVTVPNEIDEDEYCNNAAVTAKYNVVTFLPVFLYKMFSRVAYLYFLLQASLSWWSAISPYSGLGPTVGLVFVLSVAAVKEIIEDKKRHEADTKTNTSICHVLQEDGSFAEMEWRNARVGDILKINDNELLPADLLCIHTALPDEVCFIKTSNLDGETNLKIRRPIEVVEHKGDGLETSEDNDDLPSSPPLVSPATFRKTFMGAEWMESFKEVEMTVHVESPSPNLESISGFVELKRKSEVGGEPSIAPITLNEMLLRGCTLKNSGFILGAVVYTGDDTRIQMNNSKVPFKLGSFDAYLNIQIILLLCVQASIVFGCAVAATVWREQQGMFAYYLAFNQYSWDTNNENDGAYWFLSLLTYWILYSFMIPISLFVSNEIVKFWQTFIFINRDKDMTDEDGESARARNSNVVEDLGKIDYIFSDKTGTLTSNEMRLRAISIGGLSFGSKDKALEKHGFEGVEALEYFDSRLANATKHLPKVVHSSREDVTNYDYVTAWDGDKQGSEREINYKRLAEMMHEFFLAICVCHSLIIEGESEGQSTYQGPSPDEVSLVEAARQLGFEFRQRSSRHVTLAFHGQEMKYEILNVLEFTSDRKKMTVVARGPDNVIKVFCKGADSAILACLTNYKFLPGGDDVIQATDRSLSDFSCQGLRTLCVASKTISAEVWGEWDAKYQEAATTLEDREEKIAECAEEIEVNFNLLGVTAIEDKLQEGVPETIQMLGTAGIKIFMITGDKQETAISIAISCNLIQKIDDLMICNEANEEAAQERMLSFIHDCEDKYYSTVDYLQPCERREFVIDGFTLGKILGTKTEKLFAELASKCASIVVCRASPAQKAAVVKLMKEYQVCSHSKGYALGEKIPKLTSIWNKIMWKVWDGRMLAIGDGANDVAMLQSADVGIGVMGKEGRQATNNSDFAICKFRFLSKLLLVHGQLSYYRLAHLIKYSFYKNISFAFTFFFYQFFCGFSGQAIIDSMSATVYNVVLTSLPILVMATVDKPVQMSSFMKHPQTYNTSRALSSWNFWKAALVKSLLTSGLSFFVPYLSTSAGGQHSTDSLFAMGKTIYIALLGIIGIEILLLARSWTRLFVGVVGLSYVLVFAFFPLYEAILKGIKWPMQQYYGIPAMLYSSSKFWLQILLCYLIAFGVRFTDRAVKLHMWPDDYDLLTEVDHNERTLSRKKSSASLAKSSEMGSEEGEADADDDDLLMDVDADEDGDAGAGRNAA